MAREFLRLFLASGQDFPKIFWEKFIFFIGLFSQTYRGIIPKRKIYPIFFDKEGQNPFRLTPFSEF